MGSSASRRERRRLYHLYRKGNATSRDLYTDNSGLVWDRRILASVSSLLHFIGGCLKNGFPVVVRWLWYKAWAFYPFFFIRSDNGSMYSLNHERIHIRQQRDIHIVVSVPLAAAIVVMRLCGMHTLPYLAFIPFVPQVAYLVEVLRVLVVHMFRTDGLHHLSLRELRRMTRYEIEAERNAGDLLYLNRRKFLAACRCAK